MVDPNFIIILFNVCVDKFFPIVTSYVFYFHIEFILCSLGKLLETCGNFGLVMKEEHPSVSLIIINYHKALEVASQTLVGCWSK
jgi:hypothetical protein